MANIDASSVFQEINSQLSSLCSIVGVQNVKQVIKPFSGQPELFKTWIKDIEKYGKSVNLAKDKLNLIALQTSLGPVSDFIQRHLNNTNSTDWNLLKKELTSRFAEITDPHHALVSLINIRQNKDENVQVYTERLLGEAEQAYIGQNESGKQIIESQLIGLFIDGLKDDKLN